MANLVYKKTTTTNLKAAGVLSISDMSIDIDGEPRTLSSLLADFDAQCVELNVKIKDEQELDPPVEEFDPDEM